MADPFTGTIFQGQEFDPAALGISTPNFELGSDITDTLGVSSQGTPAAGTSGFMPFGSPFSSAGAEQSFFGGLGDIAQAAGNLMTAGNYRAAAKEYDYQSNLQREGVALGEYSVKQSLEATLGSQGAEVAGAGLANTGSALNLARSVRAQGGLAAAKVAFQGEQNEQELEQQAKAANAAAESASFAGIFGGILGLGKLAGSFFGI